MFTPRQVGKLFKRDVINWKERFQNQNQNQFYFRVDIKKTLKQLWATIGVRKVAKPSIPALNLFRACTLNGDRSFTV